jgi:hypothetical protein
LISKTRSYASAALIQHYVARRHGLTLPLLRIYVDLERLVGAGHLIRHTKPRLGVEPDVFDRMLDKARAD